MHQRELFARDDPWMTRPVRPFSGDGAAAGAAVARLEVLLSGVSRHFCGSTPPRLEHASPLRPLAIEVTLAAARAHVEKIGEWVDVHVTSLEASDRALPYRKTSSLTSLAAHVAHLADTFFHRNAHPFALPWRLHEEDDDLALRLWGEEGLDRLHIAWNRFFVDEEKLAPRTCRKLVLLLESNPAARRAPPADSNTASCQPHCAQDDARPPVQR